MLEFAILARGLYRPDQVIMQHDPALCMPMTPAVQDWIERRWQEKLAAAKERGTRLFDAPLYRFIEASAHENGSLRVLVGNTGYKEYVTTRTAEFAREHAHHEVGNPLSVCTVVETADGNILLDRRQGSVDVYAGRYHVIGGFFERGLDSSALNGLPDPFGAVRRELREETGILVSDIAEQYCLGVVYDLNVPHAELCFLTRLHITLDEMLHQRTPEEDEIKQLHSLYTTAASLRDFILRHHGNISATGEPNLLLYGAWKFGESWFKEMMGCISTS